MLSLAAAGVWLLLPTEIPLRVTPTFKYLAIGCLLLTLPIFWSPDTDWQLNALPRIIGLWAGLGVYFTILQCRLTASDWRIIMLAIALGAMIQALFVLTELFFPAILPDVSRNVVSQGLIGYGVFQQRNVTASFLATGMAVALVLLIDRKAILPGLRAERFRLVLLSSGIILLNATLYLLHSRTGWLGAGVTILLLCGLVCFSTSDALVRKRGWLVIALPGLGMLLGYGLSGLIPEWVKASHDASNSQRWLTIKASVQMLAQHPWKGWGYGGFEYAFQHWVIAQTPPVPSREMMNHPHNEILFWGVEGGIVPLLGLVVLGLTSMRLIFRTPYVRHKLLGLCLLPIVLHTQLEYPLYLSATHWLLLILLLASLDVEKQMIFLSSPAPKRRVAQLIIALLALAGCGLTVVALHNEKLLSDFELRLLPDDDVIAHLPLPWLAQSRYQQNIALLSLIHYENTKDSRELKTFVTQAHRWLQTREDADMYNNLIGVEYFLGNTDEVESDQAFARHLFIGDERFTKK